MMRVRATDASPKIQILKNVLSSKISLHDLEKLSLGIAQFAPL